MQPTTREQLPKNRTKAQGRTKDQRLRPERAAKPASVDKGPTKDQAPRTRDPAPGPKDPQFGNDCLCFQLRRAARLVTEVYDDEVGLSGLSIAQFALLARLERLGNATQTEVAEHLTLDPTTLTRTLTPLVAKRFITKVRGATDGRARHLQLTAEGTARLRVARPQWRVAQEKLKKALGDHTWHALHGLLKDVAGVCGNVRA